MYRAARSARRWCQACGRSRPNRRLAHSATRAADRPLPPTAVYERAAAVIACVIVAARFPIQQALTVGIVMALALSPVWTGALRRYRGAAAVVVLGVLALASGVLLTGA